MVRPLKTIKYVWLDDLRNPNNNMYYGQIVHIIGEVDNFEIIWLKSYYDFKEWLDKNGVPDYIDFDHDLGLLPDGTEKNGYDCAKILVQYCLDNDCEFPKYNVHSSNPVGAENIHSLIKSYYKIANK